MLGIAGFLAPEVLATIGAIPASPEEVGQGGVGWGRAAAGSARRADGRARRGATRVSLSAHSAHGGTCSRGLSLSGPVHEQPPCSA